MNLLKNKWRKHEKKWKINYQKLILANIILIKQANLPKKNSLFAFVVLLLSFWQLAGYLFQWLFFSFRFLAVLGASTRTLSPCVHEKLTPLLLYHSPEAMKWSGLKQLQVSSSKTNDPSCYLMVIKFPPFLFFPSNFHHNKRCKCLIKFLIVFWLVTHTSGVCNLCNGGVKFVRDNDRNK